MKAIVFFVVLIFYFSCVSSCPRHQYVYNVVDLPEPTLRALGEYITKLLKVPRGDLRRDSCHDHESLYLDEFAGEKKFDSVQMAGIFMHQYHHAPAEVFTGIRETERALKHNCTFNLLMTKNMQIRRFMVENTTSGSLFETFMTEDEMFAKIAKEKDWTQINVIHCQHFLHHVSTTYARNKITVAMMDGKDGSEEQKQFASMTDIGGFMKKGCVMSDVEDCDE